MMRSLFLVIASLGLAACSTAPIASRSTSSSSSVGGAMSSSSGAGGADAAPPPAMSVLFVGNSYTYVNDLPTWVKRVGDASGAVSVTVDSVTVAGASLADHVSTTGAVDRIRKGGFTYVVLQGQSLEPLFNPASFEAAAADLAAEAQKAGATPIFYETWARAANDATYQDPLSGGTPAAMQAGLRNEYQKVATAASAPVAPAGDAWEKALAELPAIGLFAADGSHPSIDGTYLVACVFHAKLTGHSPVGVMDRPMEISAADAAALQGVAEETVGAPP